MGLQFCNEMVLASHTVFSASESQEIAQKTCKEEIDSPDDPGEKFGCAIRQFKIGDWWRLIKKNLHLILDIGSCLPPTIRLIPTRSYTGSPIGTTYTVSVFPTHDDGKVFTALNHSLAMLPLVASRLIHWFLITCLRINNTTYIASSFIVSYENPNFILTYW